MAFLGALSSVSCSTSPPHPAAETCRTAQIGAVVNVCGKGPTLELAHQDALRRAVEFSSGTTVAANRQIRNDRLVEDSVVSHTGAYLSKVDVISERAGPDGNFDIHILAQVETGPGTARSYRSPSGQSGFDGPSAYAKIWSQTRQASGLMDLWHDATRHFPAGALVARLSGPVQVTAKDDQTAAFTLPTEIRWNPDYLDGLIRFLRSAAPPASAPAQGNDVCLLWQRRWLAVIPFVDGYQHECFTLQDAPGVTGAAYGPSPVDRDLCNSVVVEARLARRDGVVLWRSAQVVPLARYEPPSRTFDASYAGGWRGFTTPYLVPEFRRDLLFSGSMPLGTLRDVTRVEILPMACANY